MNLGTFLFINFIVAIFSDIFLNDISTLYPKTHILGSLKPYFKNKLILEAGLYAGITIIIAVLLVSMFMLLIFGKKYMVPINNYALILYCIIAYILGYIIDVIIEKMNIFGDSLTNFYKITGSGHSGAIALIFSIVISYLLQKYLLPLL